MKYYSSRLSDFIPSISRLKLHACFISLQTKAQENIIQTLFEDRGYPKGIFRLTPIVRGQFIPKLRDQPPFDGHEKSDDATPGPSGISDQSWMDDIDDFNYVSSMMQCEMKAIKNKTTQAI